MTSLLNEMRPYCCMYPNLYGYVLFSAVTLLTFTFMGVTVLCAACIAKQTPVYVIIFFGFF